MQMSVLACKEKHMGDIIVLVVLGLAVLLAVARLRKDKRKGGCRGNCGGCDRGCNTKQ